MGKKSGKVRVALREVIRVYVAAGWGIHDCTAANKYYYLRLTGWLVEGTSSQWLSRQDQICLIPDMISSALSELWSSWRQGPLTKFNLNNLFDVAILVLPHHVRAPLYHSCRRPTVFFSLEFVWRGINLNRELEMPNAGKGGCLWEAVLLLWLATATNWVPPSTSTRKT
ncbi:uncharacterized protein LAJ45_11043 [Morchella importuna]|uniref:uncharacterized protein n=1 Tax=Morchella importuna TaxID=1174673 RepID=UPI001E8CF42B|nr:uncharacterized protein LAJ45_11043 [Morchella importuna]KAH8144922.1 hypothetical protein LAJ45_11043 [Morchella importuna]